MNPVLSDSERIVLSSSFWEPERLTDRPTGGLDGAEETLAETIFGWYNGPINQMIKQPRDPYLQNRMLIKRQTCYRFLFLFRESGLDSIIRTLPSFTVNFTTRDRDLLTRIS